MLKCDHGKYDKVLELTAPPEKVWLEDHLDGFDNTRKNFVLDHLQEQSSERRVWHCNIAF